MERSRKTDTKKLSATSTDRKQGMQSSGLELQWPQVAKAHARLLDHK
jgi:hypothetical protein